VGDFDADGIPDLVVATVGSNGQMGDVSIFLGKGDGTFAPAINIPVWTNATGIAVGNFVQGGPLDVVSIDQGSSANNLVLTITDGTGHLASQTLFTVPNTVGPVAVGPDSAYMAVITGPTPGGVAIYKSHGNGTFAVPATVDVDSYPDGIVTTSHGIAVTHCPPAPALGQVTTLVPNGSTFKVEKTYTVGHCAAGIATGSFTGKGDDLIVANNRDNTVQVLLDDGAGNYTVQAPFAVEKGPYGVVVYDFKQNGKTGFAVTSQTSNTVSIFASNGNGTFSAPEIIPLGKGPRSIAAAPFTKRSKIDMAVVNSTDGTLSNLLSFSDPYATATVDKITVTGSGSHQVVAKYSGDSNYDASQSNAVTLKAPPVTTSLELTGSETPQLIDEN
jgi:hypothetical protein